MPRRTEIIAPNQISRRAISPFAWTTSSSTSRMTSTRRMWGNRSRRRRRCPTARGRTTDRYARDTPPPECERANSIADRHRINPKRRRGRSAREGRRANERTTSTRVLAVSHAHVTLADLIMNPLVARPTFPRPRSTPPRTTDGVPPLVARLVHEGQRLRVPAPVRQAAHADVPLLRQVQRVQGARLSVQALSRGREGL